MSSPHIIREIPANQNLSISNQGKRQLIRNEGLIRHYYNDSVHNCTYGVGTLAHLGPCTAQELHRHVTDSQLVTSLQSGIGMAESAIRRTVTRPHLTQQQFDALVSFTYNVGPGAAHHVLGLVNSGQFSSAANEMTRYIHATVRGVDGQPQRDRNGHIVTRVLHGLVTRRAEESAPFRMRQHGGH